MRNESAADRAQREMGSARLMDFCSHIWKAEDAGEIDDFNPHRPWGEPFRFAVELACRLYETPEERSYVLSQWLEAAMSVLED